MDFPAAVSGDRVVEYVAELNDREDLWEGPLSVRIGSFDYFKLTTVRLPDTDVLDWHYDPGIAAEYAALPGDAAPPIVFDPICGEIIDGFHRARAALLRGELLVPAYVGNP